MTQLAGKPTYESIKVTEGGVPMDEQSPDVILAVKEIQEHSEQYEIARDYDDINLWEAMLNSREGQSLRQADIEFDPNFCGVVIDTVHNKMEITSVTATTDGETPNQEATAVLNQIWDDNQLGLYWPVWQRKSLRDGDGYLVAWPSESEAQEVSEGDSEDDLENDAQPIVTKMNITYVDPCNGRMFYESENPREKRYFAQMWEVHVPGQNRPDIRLNLLYRDRIEKYIAKNCNNISAARFEPLYEEYELIEDEDSPGGFVEVPIWPAPNPFGEIPVFHIRTDLDYGKPEHRNAFALQDGISKLVEMQMVTVHFQGWPQAYALQEADSFKSQAIEEDPLADSSPASTESELIDALSVGSLPGERHEDDNWTGSRITFGPGSIALLKGFKEVGQLTHADPQSFLEPIREYARMISATTDTPLYKFQGLGGQTPSGESLKIVDAPANKKAKDRMRLFTGGALKPMFEFCLRLMGVEATVAITWANPAFTDFREVWELVKLKIELGIDPKDAFMDAGVPEEKAKEWAERVEARRQNDLAGRPTGRGSDEG